MGYNRAHQLNIDNQSPPEDDFCDETWEAAVQAVAEEQAKDDCDAVARFADPYTESALYAVMNGQPLPFSANYLRALYETAKSTQAAVQSRYDALMASRGAP